MDELKGVKKMNVTKETLRQILDRLEMEPEFKGYSFTMNKDLLSLDGVAVHQDNVPWTIHIRLDDPKKPILLTFEIDAKNSMNSDEFEGFVRAKASGAIVNSSI